ncbi:DUF6048 family protein [Flammeovirgaceae bacterium SG7u.111]|nr:DUF6048 family protein [Flammeovirgaceae bacterium SG7u.132]WPO35596.1 DUF6048 family protein [Flammeovirgaceae bacterium SG7u.111]
MIRLIFIFFFSFLVLTSVDGVAQKAKTGVASDSLMLPKVKPPRERLYLAGVRFGADITKLALTGIDPDFVGAEVKFEVLINNKFFIPIEYGISEITRTDDPKTFEYTTTGSYYRVGFDYCTLNKKSDDHAVNIGMRYAWNSFDNSVNYSRSDDYWGEFENTVEEKGLSGSWVELVVGLKYMFLKNLYLGMDARLKFIGSVNGGNSIDVSEMPGFGVTLKNTRPELNYSILYRIPFGKKKLTILKARE